MSSRCDWIVRDYAKTGRRWTWTCSERSRSARLATRHFEHPPRGRPVALILTAVIGLLLTETDCRAAARRQRLDGESTEIGRLARRFWTTYWTTWAAHSGMATKDVVCASQVSVMVCDARDIPPY